MELVRGVKITEYCDQNNLSTRDRLDLFIKVCQAILEKDRARRYETANGLASDIQRHPQ